MRIVTGAAIVFFGFIGPPIAAQERPADRDEVNQDWVAPSPVPQPSPPAGKIGPDVGQRSGREQIARDAGIEPMARINSRVQNRVQSRIGSRLDRYYNVQTDALSQLGMEADLPLTAETQPPR